jgi:hypothetical protein
MHFVHTLIFITQLILRFVLLITLILRTYAFQFYTTILVSLANITTFGCYSLCAFSGTWMSTLNGKGKCAPINYHDMKTYGGVQILLHAFLASALVRFTPQPLTSPVQEQSLCNKLAGDWLDPRSALDLQKIEKLLRLPKREPRFHSRPAGGLVNILLFTI